MHYLHVEVYFGFLPLCSISYINPTLGLSAAVSSPWV